MQEISVDPYFSLAVRHKLPYTYSFCTDFYGNEFMVREVPRDMYFKGPDPSYLPLCSDVFSGEEYEVGDEFPENSIVTPGNLLVRLKKTYGKIRTYWVKAKDEVDDLSSAFESAALTTKKKSKGKKRTNDSSQGRKGKQPRKIGKLAPDA